MQHNPSLAILYYSMGTGEELKRVKGVERLTIPTKKRQHNRVLCRLNPNRQFHCSLQDCC